MNTTPAPAGFYETLAAKRGEKAATVAWQNAAAALDAFLAQRRIATSITTIRTFLASEYGTRIAQDVLNGTPLERQLEERPARLIKHFNEVCRRGA